MLNRREVLSHSATVAGLLATAGLLPQSALAAWPQAAFEAMGFQVRGARGTQVLMNTQDYGTDGLMGVLDVAPIYQSVEVRQIHSYLLAQHGRKAMLEAEKTAEAKAVASEKTVDANAAAREETSEVRKDAASAKREAEYATAKEKCDAFAGDAKSSCLADAKSRYGD